MIQEPNTDSHSKLDVEPLPIVATASSLSDEQRKLVDGACVVLERYDRFKQNKPSTEDLFFSTEIQYEFNDTLSRLNSDHDALDTSLTYEFENDTDAKHSADDIEEAKERILERELAELVPPSLLAIVVLYLSCGPKARRSVRRLFRYIVVLEKTLNKIAHAIRKGRRK